MSIASGRNTAEKPLRDVVLNREELVQHALKLAQSHAESGMTSSRKTLLPRLSENIRSLRAAYREISDYVKQTNDMVPAAEWFLDNFYLIKDLELQIRHNLPPRYERKLLIVNTGPWQGYPRVFALMVELIEHCDSQLHAEVLRDFINSYQKINPLSSGELWAIPIMLSIALLENIRRLITQALYTIRERQAAACWLRPLSDLENLPEQWEAVLPRRGKPGRFSAPYAARVVEEIRKFGPEAAPLIRWFDQELEAQDASAESLCEIERHRQTAAQVTMGHAITSLRFLAGENWPRFFEEVSAVEKVLQTDPAQVYGRMEFSSRDHYRHNVEQIARRFKVSEIDVAQRAIDFSQQAASSAGLPEFHVGFFLIGPGRQRLEQVLAARPGNQVIRLTNRGYWSLRDHPQAVYFSLVAGLSALVLYLFVWLAFLPGSGKTGLNLLPLVIAAALLSSLNIGIKLVNWTMTRLVTPTFLPKLQLYDGIPTELRTMVVIPTFLTTVSRIKELVSQLEVYYLANQDANLHFALLTDFPDAKQEHLPGDLELLNTAIGSIKSLNGKYGQDRFFLFHRKRQFNQAEQLWMGWERKRGKLLEFNRLLRNAGPTSYSEKIGDLSILPQIRYVITLDADTQLPRDSAKRLIGTIAHPLHAPVLNNDASRVVAGYGIVQPRISISVENAGASIFARISAGKVGVDPYTTAVSDVYQDLFGEGCFTGKGIYNVEFFDKVTWQAFPENTILSHDLLEGLYARTGLATDIELIDGCPAKYHAHVQRVHRWTRGDWQIIRWLFRPLPLISKWKLIDNLRRSLEAPSQLALILLAFWVLPGGPFIWSGLVVLDIVLPVLLGWLNLASKTENKHTDKIADGFLLVCLQLMFLPYQAYIQLDAIVRSIWRQAVSHRHLLEWEPAAETERRLDCSLRTSWQLMWPAIAFILAYTAALFVINSLRGSQFMALAVLWLLSPWVAYHISRPAPDKEEMLPEDARRDLRHFARQIWAFFEDHVNASENWLPPDNVQIDPPNGVAHRTSPTNVGLALLANLAAREFGYLTLDELFARVGNSLDTVSRLEEWKGHLLNWYDTRTLAPLQPKYVSTVDSGNFVGYLLTLQTGLAKLEETPVLAPTMAEGLLDTVELCLAGLPEDGAEQTGAASRTRLTDFAGTLRDLIEQAAAAGEPAIDVVNWYLTLRKWQGLDHLPDDSEAHFWASRIERMVAGFRQELLFFFPWVRFVGDSDQSAEIENMRKLSALSLNQLARGYEAELEQCSPGLRELLGQAIGVIKSHLATSAQLQKRLEERALATDFKPLYDQERQLFAIGYRVNEHQLDQSYYDLLASEARQASFIAIAKGDISKNHWFRLGRSLTKLNGWRSLVSWSGTMFEFLMPLLVMRSYPGTLLAETYRTVVEVQRQYGKRQNIPWGISESGFYAFDTQLNYQYKAFGVPGLGLKRGLIEDLVIAPYATFLAAMVAPRQAVTNLRQMRSKGFAGRYGLYEAIDFTAERLQAGRDYKVVQSYMAHHQGMSLLALTNTIYRRKLQSLFHSIPMVKATELLLQERIPGEQAGLPLTEEREIAVDKTPLGDVSERKDISLQTAHTAVPVTHFISNGQYSVMLTNAGSGFSRFGETAVSRWREDVTKDDRGFYFYIQNLNSGIVWSATYQPYGREGEEYKVTYAPDRAEFCRRDGNITTRTEVIVTSEDQVEIRRLSLTNHSEHERTLELTSYLETVLARPTDDLAHPAFSNLFVETEFTGQSLLASRRPRRDGEVRLWAVHTLALAGEGVGALQFETDRARFIGRGRDLSNPLALELNQPLSKGVGAVLDPILSLRQRVRLKPGQTAKVSFSLGIAESREEALRLAEKYRDPSVVERAFELAWTYSQMELRHLNLTATRANNALALGGHLLYLSPSRREAAQILARNHRGQSSLWPYAISGDLPIVLVRVQEHAHLGLVRELMQMHEYWHLKGIRADLVILNEDKSGYFQALQDALRDLVATAHTRGLLNKAGGIFLLQRENMPDEDVVLLDTVARLTFSGQDGSLVRQVQRKQKTLEPVKSGGESGSRPDQSQTAGLAALQSENSEAGKEHAAGPGQRGGQNVTRQNDLVYANSYGGFSADGREYVIDLHDGDRTPLPWINVISNGIFGFQIAESGSGYTWSLNSRENKLTPWSNDAILDPPGEVVYLRDEETGELWSPTPAPFNTAERYRIRHGQGYSVFEHQSHELEHVLSLFVSREDPVKVIELKLRNDSGRVRHLSCTYYAELVMGVARELTAPFLVTEFRPEEQVILARNTFQEEFADRLAFLAGFGGSVAGYTGDRTEFIGRNGRMDRPHGLRIRRLSNKVGAGFDPCAALQLELEIAPGECKQVYFLLGETAGPEAVLSLLKAYSESTRITQALEEVKRFWDELLGVIQIETPEKSMDLFMNRWLLYQTVVCRLWARSAFYQSGGAFGFRDQLQDVMSLVVARPQWVREQIILHCAHQFVEGDVQHWWHPERSKGIRTKFSDDLLWLPFVTADYLEHTGDFSLLEERVSYLEMTLLGEDEDEHYAEPQLSQLEGTVYEHCLRALERGLRFGEHGLPLIGSGDWNDGFSRIGIQGRGESIWLGWFIYVTITRFSRICELHGEPQRSENLRQTAKTLLENLEQHGWDGGWYRRAYFDDGTPLGSCHNEECQIDAIAQAWAAISGSAKPSRVSDAMLAVEHYLWRRSEDILVLLTPPFNRAELDPGYIKGYVPGVRENGGQYTHAAVWTALAYTVMGDGNKAGELFQMLLPVNHARTKNEAIRYKVEPYVMAADVYAISPHTGRGGWTWYTGASGWMYQVGLEGMLGFNLKDGKRLRLNPCIPAHWPGYKITYRFGQSMYHIVVENPNGKMSGIETLICDGQQVENGEIELCDDGKDHDIKLIM